VNRCLSDADVDCLLSIIEFVEKKGGRDLVGCVRRLMGAMILADVYIP